jgi:cyclase
MYRPRIIPVLLLKNEGLIKTIQFGKERYIGDPINAVHVFNGLKADEIVLLDVEATNQNRPISMDLVRKIAEEANMPFSVGGGICTIEQIAERVAAGSEKVILNTIAINNKKFIQEAALQFGSSTLVACMDVKKNWLGKYQVCINRGRKSISGSIVEQAKQLEAAGIGEIIIQSVDRDGMMGGYDLELVKQISASVSIPITALGGASGLPDMKNLLNEVSVNGLAAGSMFIYHGARNGILVNYPEKDKMNAFFNSK